MTQPTPPPAAPSRPVALVTEGGSLQPIIHGGPHTTRLGLPQLQPAQARKSQTVNEALAGLDSVVQLTFAQSGVSTLSSDPEPAPGEARTLGLQPDAPLQDFAHAIACWNADARSWSLTRPASGWRAYDMQGGGLVVFDGAGWTPVGGQPIGLERLSIGQGSDPVDDGNALSVSGTSTLLSAPTDKAEGASHRLSINSSGTDQTASIVFQSDFTGRAEIGLTGSDALTFKVSDGTQWRTALTLDAASGAVDMPLTPKREVLTSARQYFVAEGGHDANDGLSADAPKRTIQSAVDQALRVDAAGYTVSILVSVGTYARVRIGRPMFDGGKLVLVGDTSNPSAVRIEGGSSPAMLVDAVGARVQISGMSLGGIVGLWARNGSVVSLADHVAFEACASRQISADNRAVIDGTGTFTFEGDGAMCLLASTFAHIQIAHSNVTLTDTPAYSNAFIHCASMGQVSFQGNTVNGSATGPRFRCSGNSLVKTGNNPDGLPGHVAGAATSGGVIT